MSELKLELDTSVRPEFKTYHALYESDFGETEVWVCLTSESFGISQVGKSFNHPGDNEDIIILNREELFKLQALVNQAAEMFGEIRC